MHSRTKWKFGKPVQDFWDTHDTKTEQMGQATRICVNATEWGQNRWIFSLTTNQSREMRLQCEQRGKDSQANNKRDEVCRGKKKLN